MKKIKEASEIVTKINFAYPIYSLMLINKSDEVQNSVTYFKFYFIFWQHCTVCRIFPDQGSNLCPLQWMHEVLAIGPPEKFC